MGKEWITVYVLRPTTRLGRRRCEVPISEDLWDAAGNVARWEVQHTGAPCWRGSAGPVA
jgi:hypothetical protein